MGREEWLGDCGFAGGVDFGRPRGLAKSGGEFQQKGVTEKPSIFTFFGNKRQGGTKAITAARSGAQSSEVSDRLVTKNQTFRPGG